MRRVGHMLCVEMGRARQRTIIFQGLVWIMREGDFLCRENTDELFFDVCRAARRFDGPCDRRDCENAFMFVAE